MFSGDINELKDLACKMLSAALLLKKALIFRWILVPDSDTCRLFIDRIWMGMKSFREIVSPM